MGMFDSIQAEHRLGQVKTWRRELRTYVVGDIVPALDGHATYSIQMQEGGYVNIDRNRLTDWTDTPRHMPVFNKWGEALPVDDEPVLESA